MRSYLFGRLLQSFLVLVVGTMVVFTAISASGDPAALMSPMDASAADITALRVRLGLDRPLPVQYVRLLGEFLGGELQSFRFKRPPMELVLPHLGHSLQLSLVAMPLAVILAIPLGTIAAVRRGSLYDGAILSIALVGQAVPIFLLSILMIWVFSVYLRWLPVSGRGTIAHLVLPVASLTVLNLAILVRLTRSSVLEILDEDFVRTARSKGLHQRVVVLKHVLRNASIPIVSLMGMQLGAMLSGALVVETIFSWPGLGKLMYDGVLQRDVPLVTVGTLVITVMVTILNLSIDLLYAMLDPRIRYT